MKKALALLLAFLLCGSAFADERYSEMATPWIGWGEDTKTVAALAETETLLISAEDLEKGNYYTREAPLLVYIDSDGVETELGYGWIKSPDRLPRGGIPIRRAVEREVVLEYLLLPDGGIEGNVPEEVLTDPVVVEEREDGTLMRQTVIAYDFEELIISRDGAIPDQTFRFINVGSRTALYFLAQDMSGLCGVIDENCTWILPPVYMEIDQVNGFFCLRDDGMVDVFREDSLELIGNYPTHPELFSVESLNSAVFRVLESDARAFYSWATGEELFRIPLEDGEVIVDPWSGEMYLDRKMRVYGYCYGYVLGNPARLVRQDKETGLYALIDLSGKTLTEELQLLELLIWNQDRGYYLFGSYKTSEVNTSGWSYSSRPERYGKSFRCGIMDQDGNIVLEAEYTDITVLSPRELLLWQGEETVAWTIPD